MPDKISPLRRSENMRRIRSHNTSPEIKVRQALRGLDFTGYRLHRRDLPGVPDIAFIGRRKAIFIHGCFWHAHDCKEGLRRPKSNLSYWLPKIDRNKARDSQHLSAMYELGWHVLTIWDCELKDDAALKERLKRFLTS
ncbi:MAG: DNA mismatch endonuclease Vsr [Proteobacteria bacterium]|nr:DNA mismatch endonuclease Vsr [Pseudomonadota bacterium]